jgi:hypothetical protein
MKKGIIEIQGGGLEIRRISDEGVCNPALLDSDDRGFPLKQKLPKDREGVRGNRRFPLLKVIHHFKCQAKRIIRSIHRDLSTICVQ